MAGGGLLLAAIACTPLGAWIYDDPAVSVARVRLDPDAGGVSRPPVQVALAIRNPNDYALSSTRVELKLRLDDQPIGALVRDSTIPVPEERTSTIALPLVMDASTDAVRLRGFGSGTHRFHVEGRATFLTPFGNRKVRFAEEGELAFGPPE